jgi:hypothetical protein
MSNDTVSVGPAAAHRADGTVTSEDRPAARETALAGRITRAVREVMANPELSVRTTALGDGMFQVRLPRTAAGSVGIGSTGRTAWLERLEQVAGARITVTAANAAPRDTWSCVVLLQAVDALGQPSSEHR